MNVQLKQFEACHSVPMKAAAADFFDFHGRLVGVQASPQERERLEKEVEETIVQWQEEPSVLYTILADGDFAGFLRLNYRGDQVAWIEDLYVCPELRGQGIARKAIGLAEKIVAEKPGYTAICIDVVSRNDRAIDLYYRLGYDSLSLLTMRKEFGENPRDRRTQVLGREFKI